MVGRSELFAKLTCVTAIISILILWQFGHLRWGLGKSFQHPAVLILVGFVMTAFAVFALKSDYVSKRTILLFSLVMFLGILIRTVCILGSSIDVLVNDIPLASLLAGKLLLSGNNPYGKALMWRGLTDTPYAYLPLTLLYYLPFVAFAVDLRFGNLVADVLVFLAFFLTKRSQGTLFLGTVFFLFPIHLIENVAGGNNDIIWTMFTVFSILFILRNRPRLSGMFMGLSLASKPFSLLAFPFVLFHLARKRRDDTRNWLITAVVTAALVMVPFLAWNWRGFVQSTIAYNLWFPNWVWTVQQRQIEYIGLGGIFYALGAESLLGVIQIGALVVLLASAWLEKDLTLEKTTSYVATGLIIFVFANRISAPHYYLPAIILFLLSIAIGKAES